jgi:diacylglycerol kinase (ATP)
VQPPEARKSLQPSEDAQPSTSSVDAGATSDFVLVNPTAGGGRAAEILPSLRRFAQEQKWPVEFCVTESREDLAAKARSASTRGHRRLFVLGGDGTFQDLLNALADRPDIVLGMLPAGGGNDLAAALGLPADPLRAASQLLARGEAGHMDAVRVRTSDGRERLYTGGGGVGIDAEASRYASGAYRKLRGRFRYLLSAVCALFGFHSLTATISMGPGEPRYVNSTALLIAVLNTPSYGAGICLAPEANTTDGVLDLVILQDRSIFKTLRLLPSLWSKGRLDTDHVQRFRVTRARIETTRPSYFHGDGEILGRTPVEISVIPQAFRVLRAKGENEI